MYRSSRSVWKIPYVPKFFLSKTFFKFRKFITTVRNVTITRKFRRKKIRVYSGRTFKRILRMRKHMRGYKLGAFIGTKVFGRMIAKSMARKQKQKKLDKKKK